MRNYALDTKMLPKVWITWASTKNRMFDQRHWLNCQTGTKKTKPESWMRYDSEGDIDRWPTRGEEKITCGVHYQSAHGDKLWVKSGSVVRFAYVKYHADIDRLEMAVVGVDTTRKVEPHPWHFLGDRFFLGKDKSILDHNGNVKTNNFNLYEYHSAWDSRELIRMLLRLTTIKDFVDEFTKFLGSDTFTIGNGSIETANSPWKLQRWYETVQKVKLAGKQQKLVDELTSIELSDASDFAERYPEVVDDSRTYSYGRVSLSGIVYYEKVKDDWHVLRKFNRHVDNILTENQRIYICDNGTVRITSLSGDTWIPSKYTPTSGWYAQRYYLANKDEAIANCNRIKYILNAVDGVSVGKLVDFLVASVRFPEIEQISKLGYVDQILDIVSSHQIKADLKYMFGGNYNDKEKNILRKVGMTKNQFDTYMSADCSYRRKAMSNMHVIFGDSLTHLDNDSFDKYFNACIGMSRSFWWPLSDYAAIIHVDAQRFFKNLARLHEKRSNVFQIANDTLNAYSALNYGTAPDIDWYFDDVSDLTRAHDAITELNRLQLAERRARYSIAEAERNKQNEEKRAKIDEKRKDLEYEDENYLIRLPKDLGEIVKEGSAQRICIGGYTCSHAEGRTNLFFLRKKDDEDTPFYAIEMDNNKCIRQIHGFGNKWLGNDPDAIPTVVRWLRKNGITCDEKILTCKATGYGRVNEYVEMPVVD